MRKFQNITEIKEANRAIGHHWFDADTIRFFGSRVEGGILRGQYFISSEQDQYRTGGHKRQFSLRLAHDDGKIDTIGNFCATPTREQCKSFLALLPDYLPDALRLAQNSYNSGEKNEFKKHLIGDADRETFTGACVWLVQNRELLGVGSWLTWFTD